MATTGLRRVRLEVTGLVQGVGFRPFVHRLATSLGLDGFVRNDPAGVTLEVQGGAEAVGEFLGRLHAETPPLSWIDSSQATELPPGPAEGFRILDSDRSARPSTLVTPDSATCDDCLRELFEPGDRRFRYPFINCTNCGPRYTIVRGIPYDRPLTTMAGFAMCGPCRDEYDDPSNRRFHAQPNACPECGPAIELVPGTAAGLTPGSDRRRADAALRGAVQALRNGAILAVKGVGGYHLACLASDEEAVSRLRRRKHREDKPFALMVPDLAAARTLVALDDLETRLLTGRQRPIVLARRRPDAAVAEAVAPGRPDLGIMLPYSPLHHLLLADLGATLVMTSGNHSDEPIAYLDADAIDRLAPIADWLLTHNRPIQTRTDDSVLRVVTLAGQRRPLMLRRSRGYVPVPLQLPGPTGMPLLACGAHLKNTFLLAEGHRAWVSPHIGDLENLETLLAFQGGVEQFQTLFQVNPELLVHDMHPGYLSTRYALERAERSFLKPVSVQHHHAHLAAVLAEHGESGPALGIIYDGTGHGPDETVWGGELLVGDCRSYTRIGHLWPVRMPGGEAAIREPWRMACAWLCEMERGVPGIPSWLRGRIDPKRWELAAQLARGSTAAPVTTSMGRLFDAISALCGLRLEVNYEGQAAIELEAAATEVEPAHLDREMLLDPASRAPAELGKTYRMPVGPQGTSPLVLDARTTVAAALADLHAGAPPGVVARRFHAAVAEATVTAIVSAAEWCDTKIVVLAGGVFQNVMLLEETVRRLDEAGFRPLVPERLPPNDGGIAYGQAAVARALAGG